MIDYTHPGRHAHVACATWDAQGYECATLHDCDALTIVTTGRHRDVVTGDRLPGVRAFRVTGDRGRGAHRTPGVSLVKSYV